MIILIMIMMTTSFLNLILTRAVDVSVDPAHSAILFRDARGVSDHLCLSSSFQISMMIFSFSPDDAFWKTFAFLLSMMIFFDDAFWKNLK